MMKHRYPLIVFLLLVTSSVLVGWHNYGVAQHEADSDMQQALMQTLREKQRDVITPDTIRTFNRHLQLPELCGQAVLSLDTRRASLRITPHCPTLTIWKMSDQRASVALASTALLWAFGCGIRLRRKEGIRPATSGLSFGRLTLSQQRFYTADGSEVKFTPMQHQLMLMFFLSAEHRLTKTEICEALWPKKDDASETLYTLIRRLKTVLEAHSDLRIASDRGRSYQLTDSKLA